MKQMGRAVAILISLSLLAGTPRAAKPAAPPKARAVVLPSWAPKRPSPEFLRAAKVLEPVPEEAQHYSPIYVPAWELFGSLSERQAKEFLTLTRRAVPLSTMSPRGQEYCKKNGGKQIGDQMVWYDHQLHVSYKSLSPRQRALFDSYLRAWQEAERGTSDEDLRVVLYRYGAKQNLANVTLIFFVQGEHAVYLGVVVITPKLTDGRNAWIAQL